MRFKFGIMKKVLPFFLLGGLYFLDWANAALSLQTSFNVTETYTDNFFYQEKDKEDEFGTNVGPNLTLLFQNPDIIIGATYFGRVQLFVNNFDRSRYTQNANIILNLPFLTKQYRGLSVTIVEDMNFTPQLDAFSFTESQNASSSPGANPALNPNGSTGGTGTSGAGAAGLGRGSFGGASGIGGTGGTQGVFTNRSSAFFNRAGLTLGYAWTPRLTPTLGYMNQYRHFFSSGGQDSLSHTGTFSLPYLVSPYTTVAPTYSYRQTEFLGKSTQTTSADRIITHSSLLALTHSFSQTVSGTISGGVAFVKQKGATQQVPVAGGGTQQQDINDKFVARGIGSATISKTFPRGSMGLSVNQGIGNGGGLGAQATRTRTITGQINYLFTPLLNVFASAGWATNDSINGNAFDTGTYRVQTGLGYLFTRWLQGNIGYSHINQRSNGTVANDIVVNQVFWGLSAIADPWYLMR